MLPGKKYSPEDGMAILRRRAWWLLVPIASIAAAAGVYARLQPNLYRSQTRIRVVPQSIPQNYVRTAVAARIEDRLNQISQDVLTRVNLQAIVEEFNLYPEDRQTMVMEDITTRMKSRDIRVVPERGDAFLLIFTGSEPRTVQRVTERLGTLFINASERDRQMLAEGTNEFLESQLDEVKRRITDHERKIQQYKERYRGELPAQVESNYRSMGALQGQEQAILEQINRDLERRTTLERELSELELQLTEAAAMPPVTTAAMPEPAARAPSPLVDQLLAAQRDLADLELKGRKESHPDHQRQQKLIRDLEAKVNAAVAATPMATSPLVPVGPRLSAADYARQRRMSDLRDQLNALDRRVADSRDKQEKARLAAIEFQRRADAGPSREVEFMELNRDYGMLQQLYNGLLQNREQARIAANLVNDQRGERFKMLEPATLPMQPASPDRQQIALFGLIIGAALGIGAVVLLEYRDRSLKSDEDVAMVLSLPVLAVVPFMRSKREQRLAQSRRFVVHVALASSVAGCFLVLAYTLLS